MINKKNINIDEAPKDYGVYLWKDQTNNILYIGKAKNIYNRIKQYLNGSLNSYKTLAMLEKAQNIEYIICSNEKESLLLEQELIKKYRPPYNILLLDDKKYPYIVLQLKNTLEIKTTFYYKEKPNSYYYGPLPTGSGFKVIKNFLIRECLYENGLPIINKNKEFWKEKFDYAKKLLSSSNKVFINKIKEQMMEASNNQQYELAAELRDVIGSLSTKDNKNKIQSITDFNNVSNFDVIAFVNLENYLLININYFRNSTFFVQEDITIEIKTNIDDTIYQFINQFYSIRTKPPLIITNWVLDEDQLLFDFKIKNPKKGKFLNALNNAIKNIELNSNKKIVEYQNKFNNLKNAKEYLKTITKSKNVDEILIIDNSNFANSNIVSVIAYFKDFQPIFSNYRKFEISTSLNRYSDVEYIYYGLDKYFSNSKNKIPNILIVDGGKPQISEAKKIMDKYNLNISVIGLVKDDKHKTKSIIDYNNKEHIIKDKGIYNLLAHIQIEVDNYAKRFHSKKMIKNSLEGSLLKITGIGLVTENKLINHFKTYSNIYNASYEELIKVVSPKIAKKILNKK